jgi:sec-independent protein translocase protein TatA
MFGSVGPTELILIFVVALLVFGPKKLPEIGRSVGKAIREFKKTSEEIKGRIEEEIEASEIKDISKDLTKGLKDIQSEVTSAVTGADVAEPTKSAEAKDVAPIEEIKDDPYKDIDTHDDGEGQKIP